LPPPAPILAPTIAKAHAAAPPKQVRPPRLARLETARARRAARPAAQACLQPTPADRLICANPALKADDRQMKRAYEAALAAGANPLQIDERQARWRAERDSAATRGELYALYRQRIAELRAAARAPAPEEPPS
jgi:uncharacterized protein